MKIKFSSKGELLLALITYSFFCTDLCGTQVSKPVVPVEVAPAHFKKLAAPGDGIYVDQHKVLPWSLLNSNMGKLAQAHVTNPVNAQNMCQWCIEFVNGDQLDFFYWPQSSVKNRFDLSFVEKDGRKTVFDSYVYRNEQGLFSGEKYNRLLQWFILIQQRCKKQDKQKQLECKQEVKQEKTKVVKQAKQLFVITSLGHKHRKYSKEFSRIM